MISLVMESKHVASKVIDQAVTFFGPGGLGLEVIDRAECCVRFEGGNGYVFIQVTEKEKRRGSEVTVESREWEYAAKQFLQKL